MAVVETSSFGDLLRRWRDARRVSQLELGLEADVSARHISFMETGRARPSREMVLALSGVLDVPLRERNVLLQAAGYAPMYRETSLDAPEMAQVRQALELILRRQEPFGAIVFDRRWDLVMANAGYLGMAEALLGGPGFALAPYTVIPPPRPNLMKLLFDPDGWRPHLANWETIARGTLARLQREAARDHDPATAALLESVLSYPGVPGRWRKPDFDAPQALVIPVELRVGGRTLRLFSTIASLGSPQDITLQELHIEALHPSDEETETFVRAFAARR
jgi:transcriptional regulator with XRE-family HTH domain